MVKVLKRHYNPEQPLKDPPFFSDGQWWGGNDNEYDRRFNRGLSDEDPVMRNAVYANLKANDQASLQPPFGEQPHDYLPTIQGPGTSVGGGRELEYATTKNKLMEALGTGDVAASSNASRQLQNTMNRPAPHPWEDDNSSLAQAAALISAAMGKSHMGKSLEKPRSRVK